MNQTAAQSDKRPVALVVMTVLANALFGPLMWGGPIGRLLADPAVWLAGGLGGYAVFAALAALFTLYSPAKRARPDAWRKFALWSSLLHLIVAWLSSTA